jgi:hypothetical protein
MLWKKSTKSCGKKEEKSKGNKNISLQTHLFFLLGNHFWGGGIVYFFLWERKTFVVEMTR